MEETERGTVRRHKVLRPLLLAALVIFAVSPAYAEEPFTYMMPQILWPNPRGPKAKLCADCTGLEMHGVDASRLFDNGEQAATTKSAAPVRRANKHLPPRKAMTGPHKAPRSVRHTAHLTHTVHAHPHAPALKAQVSKAVPAAQSASPCPQITAETQRLMDQRRDDAAESYLKEELLKRPYDKCIRKIFVQLCMWRAYNFMKCGNIECGARRLREALFVDPTSSKARYMLDRCYLASGVDPTDKRALASFAGGLLKQQRYVAAFVEYEHLLAVDPNVSNYIGYANAAQALGQNQLSIASYSEALKLDPLNIESWRQLGLLCEKIGNDNVAEQALSEALALNPDDVVTSTALTALLKRRIEQSPGDAAMHLKLAHMNVLTGNYAEADSEYSKAAILKDGDEAFSKQIKADRAAAESERSKAPLIRQAIATAARQSAMKAFESEGPSPLRDSLKPQSDVAFNCSCQ